MCVCCCCCYRWKVRLEFHSIILVVWCFSLTYRLLKRLVKMFKKNVLILWLWHVCVCVCMRVCVRARWLYDADDRWPLTDDWLIDWLMTWSDYMFFFFGFWFYNIYIYRWINVSLSFSFSFFTLFFIHILFRIEVFGLCNTCCFVFGLHSLHYH